MLDSGSYQLILELLNSTEIKIGALGTFYFPQGFYIYTGSAMKNLRKRVERHCRKDKKLRWHIDYLTSRKDIIIRDTLLFCSTEKQECNINMGTIEKLNAKAIIPKFGSSDCSNCPSHLLYLGRTNPIDIAS